MEQQKVKSQDLEDNNKMVEEQAVRHSSRSKLKPDFPWKKFQQKEESNYEARGDEEYLVAGITGQKKRKSEKRKETMQLKHSQQEKEDQAREEFFNLVNKIHEENTAKESLEATVKALEDNKDAVEWIVRLSHILDHQIFGKQICDIITSKAIKNVLGAMQTPLINKVALRCIEKLSIIKNKTSSMLLIEAGVFHCILTLIHNEVMTAYHDELLEIFYQLLTTIENQSYEKLCIEILNSYEILKTITMFGYSTLKKITQLQDKSEELAKRKKRGRKPKKGPKQIKKISEDIQGEALLAILKSQDPKLVKEHAIETLIIIEPKGLLNQKYALKFGMLIADQHFNLVKMNSGDKVEILACELFVRSLSVIQTTLQRNYSEDIEAVFKNNNFLYAMIEILKVKEWPLPIQKQFAPYCVAIIKFFVDMKVDEAIDVFNNANKNWYQKVLRQVFWPIKEETSPLKEQMLMDILDISIRVSKSIDTHNEVILLSWERFSRFESIKNQDQEQQQQEEIKPSIPQLIDCYLPRVLISSFIIIYQVSEQVLTLVRNALILAPPQNQLAVTFSDLPKVLLEKLLISTNQPICIFLIIECLVKICCDVKISLNSKSSYLCKVKELHKLFDRLINLKYGHLMKYCNIFDSLDCYKYKQPLLIALNITQQFKELSF